MILELLPDIDVDKGSALAELVDAPLPQSMVNGDLQARVQNTVQQFQAQGIAIEQFLQITGQSTDQFIEQLREQSVKAVKVDLALRAVATARNIVVEDADIDKEIDPKTAFFTCSRPSRRAS